MRLTPHKNEVQAVVSILQTDNEYDTLEDMAKDIIETVAEKFAERDWYALAEQHENVTWLWGPFPTENETKKFAAKVPNEGGRRQSFKLYSVAKQLDAIDEADKAYAPAICAVCAHPKGMHEHPGMATRCAASRFKPPQCDCSGYKETPG